MTSFAHKVVTLEEIANLNKQIAIGFAKDLWLFKTIQVEGFKIFEMQVAKALIAFGAAHGNHDIRKGNFIMEHIFENKS